MGYGETRVGHRDRLSNGIVFVVGEGCPVVIYHFHVSVNRPPRLPGCSGFITGYPATSGGGCGVGPDFGKTDCADGGALALLGVYVRLRGGSCYQLSISLEPIDIVELERTIVVRWWRGSVRMGRVLMYCRTPHNGNWGCRRELSVCVHS